MNRGIYGKGEVVMLKNIMSILCLALLLGACANHNMNNNINDQTANGKTDETANSEEQSDKVSKQMSLVNRDVLITPEEAIRIARKEVKGTVIKLALAFKKGRYIYRVESITENEKAEIDINADTGKVLKMKTENLNKGEKTINLKKKKIRLKGLIDPKRAMNTAISEINGTVTKWELQKRFNQAYYKVEILDENNRENEMKIDAHTGDIIEVKKEDD